MLATDPITIMLVSTALLLVATAFLSILA